MLWAGVLPALVILVVMTRVKESPVWLEQQRARAAAEHHRSGPPWRGCSILICAGSRSTRRC